MKFEFNNHGVIQVSLIEGELITISDVKYRAVKSTSCNCKNCDLNGHKNCEIFCEQSDCIVFKKLDS
jgi:hypothetical protein